MTSALRGLAIIAGLWAATAAVLPTSAQAPPSVNYTSFDATSAKPVRIGWYGATHKDCTPAPLPRIEVTEPPMSGSLTIRPGELLTSATAACPNLKIPGKVLFYQARQGATGSDHLVYQVITAMNKVDAFDVTIHVKEAPMGPATGPGKPI